MEAFRVMYLFDYVGVFAPVQAELEGALRELMGPLGIIVGVLVGLNAGMLLYRRISSGR